MIAREYEIHFKLNKCDGEVNVIYGRNDDPKMSGYDYLVELSKDQEFDFSQCIGFPTMLAKVSYSAQGYKALLGWIQVVNTEHKGQARKTEFMHDKYPSYSDIDFPFGSFGYLPNCYDSPSTWNPDNRKNYEWTASTFLTTFPIFSRQIEAIRWIAGFDWGYSFGEDSKFPTIAPLEITTGESWNKNLPLLKDKAKTWSFEEAG